MLNILDENCWFIVSFSSLRMPKIDAWWYEEIFPNESPTDWPKFDSDRKFFQQPSKIMDECEPISCTAQGWMCQSRKNLSVAYFH